MSQPFDLVIRNGLVFDGSGAQPYEADIGIRGPRIAALGPRLPRGLEEIDAKGLAVVPGFVDIHTHYDGQVCWSGELAPSTSHGVTTVAIGNCGVGFAPCQPDRREMLLRLMEGVEDIPHPVLAEGVPWRWRSFPEYLEFLSGRAFDADVCAYLPHAALRVDVMGKRGADREPATAEDRAEMTRRAREAVDAGAIGISTSRTFFHRSSDGHTTPTYGAAENELAALADALKLCGRGVLQLILDFDQPEEAFACLRRIVARSGRPLSFSLMEGDTGPLSTRWREMLDWVADANAAGLSIRPQVIGRPVGMLLGHELTLNPFYSTPTYSSLATLSLDERIETLRRPDVRTRVLAETVESDPTNVLGRMVRRFADMYVLGDPPDYEPAPHTSLAAQARLRCTTPEALAYDAMLELGGKGLLYLAAANYSGGSLENCLEMMRHPNAVLGLGDGGAHCGTICDASYTTFMLTHWARDRRGERLPLPWIVNALSRRPAEVLGLLDRGFIGPGYKADINVIDLDRLDLRVPKVVRDLPAGGRRLHQTAQGYVATLVSGQQVRVADRATGRLPGCLVRGPQLPQKASPSSISSKAE